MTSSKTTLYLQTRSGKEFHVEESGEIRAVHDHEPLGLLIGLSHRPSHVLTLLPTLFAVLEEMPVEELRKVVACVQEPNSWLMMVEVDGEMEVWPREDAVQSLQVLQRGGQVAMMPSGFPIPFELALGEVEHSHLSAMERESHRLLPTAAR